MQNNQKWTTEQIEYLKTHYSNPSILREEICRVLGRTWHNIEEKARHIPVRRPRQNRIPINHHYMDNVDSHEKAYIMGMFWADGCNHTHKGVVSISLQHTDEYILRQIADLFDYKANIYKDFSGGYNQRMLYIYSPNISKKLEGYGMVRAKSLILQFPSVVPDEFINSFLLGLFDGDGCVYRRRTACVIDMVGSYDVVKGFQDTLNRLCGASIRPIYKRKNIYRVSYQRADDCLKIRDFMYKDCSIYLYRKKEILYSSNYIPWKFGDYKRKLTESQISEIRGKVALKEMKMIDIAKEYNISPQILSRIKHGKSYRQY